MNNRENKNLKYKLFKSLWALGVGVGFSLIVTGNIANGFLIILASLIFPAIDAITD